MRTFTFFISIFLSVPVLIAQPDADVARTSNAELISSGSHHSLFIRNGALYAMGENLYGQLGIADKNEALTPVKVGAANNFVSVSTINYTTVALRQDGSLWATGFNNYGEVGIGSRKHQPTLVRVGKDTNWISIAGGETFSLAIKRNGTLWGWGNNKRKQLENGFSRNQLHFGFKKRWHLVGMGG
jgi:alpha-tubulin suppressor-like RCC1 family protein